MSARSTLGIVFTTIAVLGAGTWLINHRSFGGFRFESFEGDGSAARIADAKDELNAILPLGSQLSEYKRFFRKIGGDCGDLVADIRFPNTVVCWYNHGFLVTSEWKYVITYDPVTTRSGHVELGFGLTGL